MKYENLFQMKLTSVSSNSQQVHAGGVFVAIKGNAKDGHAYIEQAIQNGAHYIVYESQIEVSEFKSKFKSAEFFQVPDSRMALADLCAHFYEHPSREMKVIGVTGTSGKTTTTYLIESILRAAGISTGIMGTVEIRYADQHIEASQTTPGPEELQKILREMKNAQCEAVVMEVSSHALDQKRVEGVEFDSAVFTNLSPEHLDYHVDMNAYYEAKKLLFTRSSSKKLFCAICTEDEWGERLLSEIQSEPQKEVRAFYAWSSLQLSPTGIEGKLNSVSLSSHLLGKFNATNISGAVTALRFMNLSESALQNGIASLKRVPGRMDRVKNGLGFEILIDYAHKPDALEKVLKSIRATPGIKNIITVFGCGGDRDRTKRPKMGAIASLMSDQVIVTSDNPRTENPATIIQEIVNGISDAQNVVIEPDRARAIELAIRQAQANDIVLIAGKGHENYQILPDKNAPGQTIKIHFDDREIAENVVSRLDTEN